MKILSKSHNIQSDHQDKEARDQTILSLLGVGKKQIISVILAMILIKPRKQSHRRPEQKAEIKILYLDNHQKEQTKAQVNIPKTPK